MISTVRARLTLTVAVTMGAIAVVTALVAPTVVERTLLDDRFDAEADVESAALFTTVRLVSDRPITIGTPELTALFGPEIAEVATRLDSHQALEPLRDFRDDRLVRVAPAAGIVGTIDEAGRIRVDSLDADELAGPVVSLDRLRSLASAVDTSASDTLDMIENGDATFEDFADRIGRQLGDLLDDRLDPSVLDDLRELGLDLVLRDAYEALADRSADRTVDVDGARRIDEFAFGVRAVGNIEVIVVVPVDGIARTVDRVRVALWAAVPLSIVVTGLATWLLAGRALKPVRRITERTSRIRSSTLHDRVPVPNGSDEITGLATEMNTMLDRVQREDQRRRQFVADASHELRSPVAAIRIQAEAALASPDDTDTSDLATGVLAEAERIGMLVDDLLSLARHDEALPAPGSVVDLDDIVLDEARRPRPVPIDVTGVSAGQVRCRADEMTRVVTHLLDNAARHARTTVMVSLGTLADGGPPRVRLTVDDDGPGVPEADRERIFDRFVRLDDARHRDRGGAGLGLAVVATVVASCGGTVTVDTNDLGGARFVLTMPAA